MNNLHSAINDLVWQTISTYYNVDRREPRVLLYKEIAMNSNPIDKIAASLASAVEQLLTQAINKQASNEEIETPSTETAAQTSVEVKVEEIMSDDYSDGDYYWNSYGYDPYDSLD